MITAEQFAEWKEHPVTKEIFTEVQKVAQDLKERLANGHTLGSVADLTHGMTSKTVGQIEGLNQLLNISYEQEDLIIDINDVTGH